MPPDRHCTIYADIRKLRWWLGTGSGYSYDFEQDIDAIQTAFPTFLMSLDRTTHLATHCDAECLPRTKMLQAKSRSTCDMKVNRMPDHVCICALDRATSKIWVQALEPRRYLVSNQSYNNLRFINRHLSFSDVGRYCSVSVRTAFDRATSKISNSRLNGVQTLLKTKVITTFGFWPPSFILISVDNAVCRSMWHSKEWIKNMGTGVGIASISCS
jgi:hypothetical protein